MDEITSERLKFIDKALGAVAKAVGTERRFVGEPSDADLDAMRDWLLQRRESLVT
jgi:hypothetical protein